MSRPATPAILIVAAGKGERCGGDVPKQYQRLGGIPVLMHSVERFSSLFPDAPIVIAIHPDHEHFIETCDLPAHTRWVHGGETRQASVLAGLDALKEDAPTSVLIHDAARPFVNESICYILLSALQESQAALPCLPVIDTIKQRDGGLVQGTLDRQSMLRAQTPQAFHYETIYTLHKKYAHSHVTDDVSLCEQAQIPVRWVEGDEMMFKITTAADMQRAEQCIQRETRTGSGYDVHVFEPSNSGNLRLCGIDIPHTHRLKGHSDADVALHALTDAMLGALGEGDIGQHFPPSDNTFKNMDSANFVTHALTLMHNHGGQLVNADITIIGERPKISNYREQMRQRVASILACEPARVNIKATTTEGLGFEGRREGLAVHAIVTMTLPALMV